MNFAVLQKTLDIPSVEKIEWALVSVPGFTRIDAQTFANDAYGILVKNISAEQATAFSQALLGQGIETEVVAENELPPLPQTKFVQRLDCRPDALLIYDPLGRSFPLLFRLGPSGIVLLGRVGPDVFAPLIAPSLFPLDLVSLLVGRGCRMPLLLFLLLPATAQPNQFLGERVL